MSDHPIVAFIEARYAEVRQAIKDMPPGRDQTWYAKQEMGREQTEALIRLAGDDPHPAIRHGMMQWVELRSIVSGGGEAERDIAVKVIPVVARYVVRVANPIYVLADLDSKRAILLEHGDVNDGDCGTCIVPEWGYPTHGGSTIARHPCKTVRLLAAPFASHPDYLAEWSA